YADQASDSLLQSRLDSFKIQYAHLLQQLAALPAHPQVIVNEYYDPFGDTFDCPQLVDPSAPGGSGFAADPGKDNQEQKTRQKVDPLRSEMARLNAVLEQGAKAFGFAV